MAEGRGEDGATLPFQKGDCRPQEQRDKMAATRTTKAGAHRAVLKAEENVPAHVGSVPLPLLVAAISRLCRDRHGVWG